MFSSMPGRNTLSNSRPLAECSVISVTLPPPLIETVRVGHQSDVFQKIRKSALGIEPFEFGHSALQLADVLDARGVFVALDGLQRAHIARLVDHEFEEFRRGLFVERLGQVDHQLGELANELLRPGGKGRVFHVQYRGHQRHLDA